MKMLKGRIDDLVFYQVGEQLRIRGYGKPKKTAWTPSQQLQQKRLRTAVAFYRANAATPLPEIWREAAKEMVCSGYNLFMKTNMAAFSADHDILDYSLLHMSEGVLEVAPSLQVTKYGQGEVHVTWRNPLPATEECMSDLLQAVWLADNGTFTLHVPALPAVRRSNGEAVLPIPEAGQQGMHLYLYFSDKNGKRFSKDKYFYLKQQETL